MNYQVKVPAVGESITSGVISSWHKKNNEPVAIGDLLFTLETDKVSTEITATEAGVLKTLVEEGAEVKIGEVVAEIVEGGTSPIVTPQEKVTSEESKKESSNAKELQEKVEKTSTDFSQPITAGVLSKLASADEVQGVDGAQKLSVQTSSMLRAPERRSNSLAEVEYQVVGRPRDRLRRAELEQPEGRAERERASQFRKNSTEGRVTRKKLTPLRRKIAAQLVSAQQTAAILTTFNECDMSPVMSLRKEVQEAFQAKYGVKLGFMSFFIKAAVEALQTVPQINAQLEGDELIENHYYDIGVAVGTDKGLMVPVVRDCEKQSLAELEQQLLGYAGKAREGKISLPDLQGGVFTISNGGVYGSLLSTPILNPPQSAILGMHKIQERPIVVDGQIVIRPMMYLALSYDHRVVDGKQAVTFLIKIKEAIENPMALFLK
ncbi:MAG: dihydrolipoyllysine succinyltransferase [Verrucomicrobia bacterium RIFCSPHIGHO2_12_FULL_41_10]|nr:MAG: dihydrolipoyllysine succinyltransferase [Verrucomicrobia bacterium RIFCSPHIGHO2_12_FULL_41_10]